MTEFAFHPLVAEWFARRFAAPTEPQRRGWPVIAAGQHTLIAAPTGSGKTLTAFLAVIDRLFREAEAGTLTDDIRVVYVSPLRALSNDMHRNLQTPLAEIAALAREKVSRSLGSRRDSGCPELRVGLRTGDTTASQRAALLRRPPHILVTTPESLYLLATSAKGRAALRHVDTIIVDEIHALVRDKRGSHLALTLERLAALSERSIQRIGLSATQKPLEAIAKFLTGEAHGLHPVGLSSDDPAKDPPTGCNPWASQCTIIDVGHQRQLDLAVEVPLAEIGSVCTHEQWADVYQRLVELIQSHRSTLIFVNTRRMAERLSHQLSQRLGEEHVSSHHGSLSAEIRLNTERRLKSGDLKAVVATASLELGIDVGYIDLVVQLGSPRSIATFLQRIGRAGHSLHATPKGRIIPLSRDELLECLALVRAIRRGCLDAVKIPEKPLDVLVQQIVAETSFQEWNADELFALCRRAYPYRHLTRDEFDETLQWMSEGLTERSGRRHSLVYFDRVNGRLRARPHARAIAVGNAGAIPEVGNYRVVAVPDNTVIGSVDEDFAVESMRGDIFLLGNTSWRIEYVRQGDVVVSDAHGAPPTIPFWFGEAPGRTIELSTEVSELRDEMVSKFSRDPEGSALPDGARALPVGSRLNAVEWLVKDLACPPHAAAQIVEYVRAEHAALGLVPTQQQVVFERFFDETGGMQLVIHAPFGGAINRAWGYALRKRFCRSFDFELQATADDDGVILSIGPQHSFPLESLFGMLTSHNVAGLLEQAVLVQPPFQLRWRWNVTRALLVARTKFGQKVPPALQRFRADDLLTAVFPQLTGCQENHTGDIELPDHPLVRQTLHDCLHEALDLNGLIDVLRRVEAGEITFVPRDTREPSPFCYELLNAYPYAFLDGGEIQERRARAVSPGSELTSDMPPLTWLDPAAIEQVVAEAAPLVRSADELHDLLLSVIVWPAEKGEWLVVSGEWSSYFAELVAQRRALAIEPQPGVTWWVAVERWPAVQALFPVLETLPSVPNAFSVPPGVRTDWDSISARTAACRGWMEFCGPVTAAQLAERLGWTESQTAAALEALEGEGTVLRGAFREKPGDGHPRASEDNNTVQWCHRRLLARIHRLTLAGLRRQVEPVDVATFQRFLWEYQGILGDTRRSGTNGLFDVVAMLQGIDAPAVCWERDLLPPRIPDYDPQWLDDLCLTGEVGWGRLFPPSSNGDKTRAAGVTRVVPMSLFLRSDLPWLLATSAPIVAGTLRVPSDETLSTNQDGKSNGTRSVPATIEIGSLAAEIWELLQEQGALFAADLLQSTRMLPSHLEDALGELIGRGLVTADTFAGLRSLLAEKKDLLDRPTRRTHSSFARRRLIGTVAGRWSIWRRPVSRSLPSDRDTSASDRLTAWAWQLVRRWGVVFRDLLAREDGAPRWWELVPIFRRLEARGELRGGRFITGVGGEQFALEGSIQQLRKLRDADRQPDLVVINAADPLNLVGIITPPPRIPALAQNRIAYLRGVAVAALQGGEVVELVRMSASESERVRDALHGRIPAEPHTPRRTSRKPRPAEHPHQIPRPIVR